MVEKILLDYVEQVYMLESERYTLEKIIEKLKYVHEGRRLELERKNGKYNSYNEEYDEDAGKSDGILAMGLFCLAIFFIVIGRYGCNDKFIMVACYLLASLIIICGIYSAANMIENKNEMQELAIRIDCAQKECTKIKEMVNEVEKEINNFERLEAEKNEVLNYVYEHNIIHKNYRNFYGISKIYYLLDTGICDTLTGVDGAYSQMRMDQIIDNQKISIELQKELLTTNQMMYSAINRTNSLLEGISTQINELNENNASLMGVLRDNLEVSNFLTQSSKNDMAAIRSATEYMAYAERQRRVADGKFY